MSEATEHRKLCDWGEREQVTQLRLQERRVFEGGSDGQNELN